MKEEPEKTYPSNIEGLEDVRLFSFKDKLHFTASSKNITNDGKIVMTIGDYDAENAKMSNISVIQPIKQSPSFYRFIIFSIPFCFTRNFPPKVTRFSWKPATYRTFASRFSSRHICIIIYNIQILDLEASIANVL